MKMLNGNLIKRNWLKWLMLLGCVSIMLFSIFTIITASSYTVLVEDDYWHGYDVGVFGGGFWNYIVASFKYSAHMYFNWQGTYFSMFIQALLSPVNHYGMAQLRIVMLFNSVNFFVSFIGCIWVMLNRLVKCEWKIKLVICTCAVFALTAYSTFEEIFYWFSGAASYSIPVSCLFYSWIAVGMYDTLTKRKYKYISIMLAMFFGICAMGGSLTIAATGCGLLFFLCIYFFLVHKKVNLTYLSIFIVYLVGAVVNVAAPGNYIRQQTSEGEGMQLLHSLFNTYQVFESNLIWIFHRTNFGLVLLIILVCGMFLYGKINVNMVGYTIVSILSLAVPAAVIFPVVLGYNVPWMPNRCVFILLITFVLIFGNLAMITGWWIVEAVSEKNRILIMIMAALLIFTTETVNGYSVSDYSSIKIFKGLCKGTIPNYYDEYVDMLHIISGGQGTDLILEPSDIPEAIENFYCFDLSEEPDERLNMAIAYIYHLNSIAKGIE